MQSSQFSGTETGSRRLIKAAFTFAVAGVALVLAAAAASDSKARSDSDSTPNILIITVDTLRYDRLSVSGYERLTSPNIDALMNAGVRFSDGRCVEPLTGPSSVSLLTSLFPHEHAATRNAIPMREGLNSLPKLLAKRGYKSGAFVGNWTLKAKNTGLDKHFDDYEEVRSRKRWLVFGDEGVARDITDQTASWIEKHHASSPNQPFLAWAHYIEPHAPYVFHKEFAKRLKLGSNPSKSDKYDTEIAAVDASIGKLLARVEKVSAKRDTMIIFASDHGESLGEHGYWGHGRKLYDVTLKVPMSITWVGRVEPSVVDAPSINLDLATTAIGLMNMTQPKGFRGHDWTAHLMGLAEAPHHRVTYFQAHRGAATTAGAKSDKRRNGLLKVGLVADGKKEILDVSAGKIMNFNLGSDPLENKSLAASRPSDEIRQWLSLVQESLANSDNLPMPELDEKAISTLRSLGYVD